jgi:hypothetical protein
VFPNLLVVQKRYIISNLELVANFIKLIILASYLYFADQKPDMITGKNLEFAIKELEKISIENRKSSVFSDSFLSQHLEKSGNITQLRKATILDITRDIHLIGLSHERRIRIVLGANPNTGQSTGIQTYWKTSQ